MALIVKSSIEILPWTELEKQKLIEEKKEFLDKKAQVEAQVEAQEENVKNSTKKEKTSLKKQSKKEVNE